MIKSECFEKEWIDKVCSTHKFKHPELVEKVIRAFSLLEMLVKEGCPLTFKGGTIRVKEVDGSTTNYTYDPKARTLKSPNGTIYHWQE